MICTYILHCLLVCRTFIHVCTYKFLCYCNAFRSTESLCWIVSNTCNYITHSHGSARVFWRRRRKSMEKVKFRPLATPKPLNGSSQKLAGVIMSWTARGMQNFVTIGLGVSVPQIRDFCRAFGVTIVCSFFGSFNKATAYTPGRIFTQNTSNDVVPGMEVPFGGPDDYILYLDP